MQTILADGSVCSYIVSTAHCPTCTFDSTLVSPTTPQTVAPTLPIYASIQPGPPVIVGPVVAQVGQPASPYSNSAVISDISLSISGAPSPLPSPGPGVAFTGNWQVKLNPSLLVRPLVPISVATTLTVDTTNPAAAKITNCQSESSSPTGGITVGWVGLPPGSETYGDPTGFYGWTPDAAHNMPPSAWCLKNNYTAASGPCRTTLSATQQIEGVVWANTWQETGAPSNTWNWACGGNNGAWMNSSSEILCVK